MSKGKIITLSIIGFIIVLTTILFSAVFRLRKQIVVASADVTYSSEEIVKSAELKRGQSIFLIDKKTAISKIEAKFADLKVIQIKTTSLTEIEIKVRKRYPAFYIKNLGSYYVLDQDLKVLNIVADSEAEHIVNIEKLVKISTKPQNLNVETKVADFLGSESEQNMSYNLFSAVYSTKIPTTITGNEAYTEFCNLIEEISFDIGYTANGQTYDRLIVKTKQGMSFDIGKATSDLTRKINLCFTAMESEEIADKTIGTITISYDETGKEIKTYSDGIE